VGVALDTHRRAARLLKAQSRTTASAVESSRSLGDLDQLRASRSSSPDRDRRLAALKMLSDQRDQLRIRLPIHRRRLQLRHPRSVSCSSQRRLSCSRSDFDLNDPCRHVRRSCHSQRQREQLPPRWYIEGPGFHASLRDIRRPRGYASQQARRSRPRCKCVVACTCANNTKRGSTQ
jgi:hypothetical protein